MPNTLYTHHIFGLEQKPCFASKPCFTQSAVLHKNCVVHEHRVLHKNNVLAGPVQALFAACRIYSSFHGGRGTPKAQKNEPPNGGG